MSRHRGDTLLLVTLGLACHRPETRPQVRLGAPAPVSITALADSQVDLQQLVDHAGDGDTILLGPRTYSVPSRVQIQNKRHLSLLGQGPQTVVRLERGADYGFEIGNDVVGLTIARLAIQGTPPLSRGTHGIATQNGRRGIHGITLTDLDISNVAVGIRIGAGVDGSYDSVVIARNTIHDLVGREPGSGYGIHNDNASNVQIVDNDIRRVNRHSVYQARGTRNILIARNFILHHGRADPVTTNVAVAVARSSNVTITDNVIIDAYTRAISIEPDDILGWPVDSVYLINNLVLGFRDMAVWVSVELAGQTLVAWSNRFVRPEGNEWPAVADRDGLPLQLEEPAFWRGTEAITAFDGDLLVLRNGVLEVARPRYGSLADSSWFVGRAPGRWSDLRSLAGTSNGRVYAIRGEAVEEIEPATWTRRRSPWTVSNLEAVVAAADYLFLVGGAEERLYRVDPRTWSRVPSPTRWSGVQGMVGWRGTLYVMSNNCLYGVDPDSFATEMLGPCYAAR